MAINTALAREIKQPFNNIETARSVAVNDVGLLIYKVKAGDTLSGIIAKQYGIYHRGSRYDTAMATVLFFNPSITNSNVIFPGQLLKLPSDEAPKAIWPAAPPVISEAPQPIEEDRHKEYRRVELARHLTHHGSRGQSNGRSIDYHRPMSPLDEEALWVMAWLVESGFTPSSIALGAGLGTWGNLASESHNQYLRNMKLAHEKRSRLELTRRQYRNAMEMNRLAYVEKIGPFEKLLFKGKTTHEAAQIIRARSMPGSVANIELHLARLERMGRIATTSGYLLTAAGAGLGCYAMRNADTRAEKNKIFVETVVSSGVGLASSLAIAVFFVSTPAGWVAAIGLGTAAAVGSWAAGRGMAKLYNERGQKFDVLSYTGKVNDWCS